MPKITDDRPADIDSNAPADSEQLARQQAIKQIRARRRFKISTASAAVGVTLLVPIWGTTEHRNAGDWPPADSASARESPGVEHLDRLPVPRLRDDYGWARLVRYGRKPISESEINPQPDDHRRLDP